MVHYITLALIKILDNAISAAKSIASHREMALLSSILVILSQFLFFLVIDQVVNDGSLLVITIAAISSGIGNFLAFTIDRKFKKDAKYVIVITSSEKDSVKELCNHLVKNKIKYIVNDGYTREGDHTLNVIAFSKNKDESRIIDSFINDSKASYLKEVII